MGQYLTHVGSTSYEQDSMFLNKIEIMQLFTFGNEKLNVDGSFALVNDSVVSADGTERCKSFHRHRRTNWSDPLHIAVSEHDRYPKADIRATQKKNTEI